MMLNPRSVLRSVKQFMLRNRVKSREQVLRFFAIHQQYEQICSNLEKFSRLAAGLNYTPSGYDWDSFRKSVRQSFASGVPINFLSNPVVKKTMVYGTRDATPLVDFVCNFFYR